MYTYVCVTITMLGNESERKWGDMGAVRGRDEAGSNVNTMLISNVKNTIF